MNELSIWGEAGKASPQAVTAMYNEGLRFNNSVRLDDTVRANENFFIGRQWEGIEANGLPTPQFNILKRVVGFTVAMVTTDNIKVSASPLSAAPQKDKLLKPAQVANDEFISLMERNNIPFLIREFARNAAVDGDGCIFTYWEAEAETGQRAKGCIRSEVVDNTRVFFGNPSDRNVQDQPYIIISKRDQVRSAKIRAKNNGSDDWANIKPDSDDSTAVDGAKQTDDKVTVFMFFWRDDETRRIWAYECTKDCEIRKPVDIGIKLYPICWLNWDYVKDCYHGQAMITGLIPNQIFINKSWAMTMLSIMKAAYPKVIYDKTRLKEWNNGVGQAIGVNGGDMNTVAKILDPAMVSPQISEYINLAVTQTEQSMGATSVALGDTRPDNTSAIIALQRAAQTPNELTKQNLYSAVEDLFRIYLEFMGEYYGVRMVDTEPSEQLNKAVEFAMLPQITGTVPQEFDFSQFKEHPMTIKLDVGASSYYSEIASIQTLDNLLMQNKITILQYLERIPDDYIPGRRSLINDIKAQTMPQLPTSDGAQPAEQDNIAVDSGDQMPIPTGGGFGALQRKVLNEGTTEGLI